ncbi:lysophospholipid acyltransferase 7-like [Clytia hemisphaerica]|uniref:Lysophospholipid acyltransferase 7 n=1 Tax=Clytia hemisphaerica TaxID=252671 RepID=A0A7M5V989_9CNID
MSSQDVLYLCVLIGSIFFGQVIKSCGSNHKLKQALVLCSGFAMVVVLTGPGDFIHSLVVVVINYLIIKLFKPKMCHVVSFIWTFGYLLFFRTCHWFGWSAPTGQSNAVQLLVTLRMVGLAYEIHDQDKGKEEIFRHNNIFKCDLLDFFSYSYCYIGLMTGPFYSYRTFLDMVHYDARHIDTLNPALSKLKQLPPIILPFLLFSNYFPLPYLESDEYFNSNILYQLLILVPTFSWFRWRFYIGWVLAESMCITSCLGAYPVECKSKPAVGPTTKPELERTKETAYDFETTHNINITNVELAPTMRSAMKDWNMTVQWWMATYVYKKLPVESAQIRMFLLLFVSAFWHGVRPGYYLTFMSVPLVVMAETRMTKAIKPYLNDSSSYWWDWITWFCLYRSFEYTGIGFMLLELRTVWSLWTRMYFIGHFFIFLFILLPFIIPKKRTKVESKTD